jgi:hypothetical protein
MNVSGAATLLRPQKEPIVMKIYDPVTEWVECLEDLNANMWEPVPYTTEEMAALGNPRLLLVRAVSPQPEQSNNEGHESAKI